jgi:hypothetical protein
VSRFNGENAGEASTASSADLYRLLQTELARETGGTLAKPGSQNSPSTGIGPAGALGGNAEAADEEEEGGVAEASEAGGTAPLMDYLLGP